MAEHEILEWLLQRGEGWSPSPQLLAQDAHFGYGLAIAFASYLFAAPWLIPILLTLILALKEGLFDQFVEGNPLVFDGLFDWAFYCLGSLAGIALILLLSWLGIPIHH